MAYGISWTGDIRALEDKLEAQSSLGLKDVQKKSLRDIYTRGVRQYYRHGGMPQTGGTPFLSGQLRMSLGYTGDETGYTKDYGPHVEFGHRTRGGTWVPGQFFLKANVEAQRKIYKEDLIKKLKG